MSRLGVGTALLMISLLGAGASAAPADLYFFINADNDLITATQTGEIKSQGEILSAQLLGVAAQLPTDTTIHIYYDPIEQITGEKDSRIVRFSSRGVIENLRLGETNSGDERWIHKLLSVRTASRSALILWGHGRAWKDMASFDFSRPDHPFSLFKIADALPRYVDLLVFDACQMGSLEVLQTLEGRARYVLASQYELPVEGVQYPSLIKTLSRLSHETPAVWARELALALQTDTPTPLSLYDLEVLPETLEALASLSAHYSREMSSISGVVRDDRWAELRNEIRSRSSRGMNLDSDLADLRAVALTATNESIRSQVLVTLDRLAGAGRSISLYWPEEPAPAAEKPAWSEGLANWNLF